MKENPLSIILHNIRSTHNVGSIFRTADAAGVEKIYLTGYTPTPLDQFKRKRRDVSKVSLGAEESVSWEYIKNPMKLVANLKRENIRIVGVEQGPRAKQFSKMKVTKPTAFIFGNEVRGISKKLQELCDELVEIPMHGKKESLNVSVSAGIILFKARELNR